jgi:hypothetical protein
MGDGMSGGHPKRHHSLLATLAEHPHHPTFAINVIDVQGRQLAHPNAGGIQQFEDGRIPHIDGRRSSLGLGECLQQGRDLGLLEDVRKEPSSSWLGQCVGWADVDETHVLGPGKEHPRRGRSTRHRRTRPT